MIVQEKTLLYLESSEAYSRNIILMLVLCVCGGGGLGLLMVSFVSSIIR